MKTAYDWYKDSLAKYLRPSVFNTNTPFKQLPTGREDAVALIQMLMSDNTIERAGYAATSIRGYHTRYVFYKSNSLLDRSSLPNAEKQD